MRTQSGEKIGVTYDFSEVKDALERIDGKSLKKTFKKIFRQAGNKIKKPIQAKVKTHPWPRKRGEYKERPNSGILKGKYYGPLWKDVKMSVYKNAKGVNVSLFENKKKDNRWCVLMWLNDGTEERGNARSTYEKTATGKRFKHYNTREGIYRFNYHFGVYRGKIRSSHFFEQTAGSAVTSAEGWASSEFGKRIIEAYEGQLKE